MGYNIEVFRQSLEARRKRQLEQREKARAGALKAVHAVVPGVVAKYPAVKAVYLFGSILRPGAFRTDSDIDLAVEGGTAEDYFALWHELEDALPDWPVDLRDLPADTHFAQKVRATGEKIYG